MTSSPQRDYSAYVAEHGRSEKPGRPLGLEAYLLLREKLDELTLLEIQEGMLQGMDKESLDTLTTLTEDLLTEAPQCSPAPNGAEILSILLRREEMEIREATELCERVEECLHEDDASTEPLLEDLLKDLFGISPNAPEAVSQEFWEDEECLPYETTLSKSRAHNPPLYPKGKVPDSRMRRELWRLKRRREQG